MPRFLHSRPSTLCCFSTSRSFRMTIRRCEAATGNHFSSGVPFAIGQGSSPITQTSLASVRAVLIKRPTPMRSSSKRNLGLVATTGAPSSGGSPLVAVYEQAGFVDDVWHQIVNRRDHVDIRSCLHHICHRRGPNPRPLYRRLTKKNGHRRRRRCRCSCVVIETRQTRLRCS